MIDLLPWILAAAAIGLWWGERGRRLDAQRREGVIDVDPVERAQVIPPGSGASGTLIAESTAAREKFIAETMAEGHSKKDAEREWDRLLGEAQTGQERAWG